MYRLYKIQGGEIGGVFRLSDNASIPNDPANTDYQAYLKFLADGGQPLPADGDK